jgi:hypothetical protein
MSFHDEYRIVINEAQRRLIVRALTNALANDRRSSDLAHPMPDEWMQLIRLFSTINHPRGSPDFQYRGGAYWRRQLLAKPPSQHRAWPHSHALRGGCRRCDPSPTSTVDPAAPRLLFVQKMKGLAGCPNGLT